jgi:hypothetical protein
MKFSCPKCNQRIEVDDSYAGQSANCPVCAEALTIPDPSKPILKPVAASIAQSAPVAVTTKGINQHTMSNSKSYVEKTLTPGEVIIYQAKVHPAIYISMVPYFIIFEALSYYIFIYNFKSMGVSSGLLGCVFLLLPFLVFANSWFIIKSTELALTNHRVISKTGIFTQRTAELQISQIESVGVEQGIFGRFFNYGSVHVRGTGGGESPAPGIIDPFKFRKAVQELPDQVEPTK